MCDACERGQGVRERERERERESEREREREREREKMRATHLQVPGDAHREGLQGVHGQAVHHGGLQGRVVQQLLRRGALQRGGGGCRGGSGGGGAGWHGGLGVVVVLVPPRGPAPVPPFGPCPCLCPCCRRQLAQFLLLPGPARRTQHGQPAGLCVAHVGADVALEVGDLIAPSGPKSLQARERPLVGQGNEGGEGEGGTLPWER